MFVALHPFNRQPQNLCAKIKGNLITSAENWDPFLSPSSDSPYPIKCIHISQFKT